MSARGATVEEFDDDTENAMVPSVDMMQEMMAAMNASGSTGSMDSSAPIMRGATDSQQATGSRHTTPNVADDGEEDGPHKNWTCIYPIYLDAKQRYRKGCRRVAYEKAVLFPNSQYISNTAKHMKLDYVHEPYRTHPRDFANPGRVKIRLHNQDGSLVRRDLPTKQKLLEAIAVSLQSVAGGRPPAVALQRAAPKPSSKSNGARNLLRERERVIRRMRVPSTIPPHSPMMQAGMLSMDLSKMAGAAGSMPGMGPLGSMMSSMGLTDDDDDQDANAQEADKPTARPAPALGRRQRKRVVRMAR
ncbi:signal recognition particle subunit [Malassezia yamatoensis]|uniref:Signal recognition particle subunit n=1 Tax=Malassezia yamatoensis TaxID=253288 RepID=A0AAJ6CI42_9BASI|nr:signal recognition particle subunit [Malassezia yamatoensis]